MIPGSAMFAGPVVVALMAGMIEISPTARRASLLTALAIAILNIPVVVAYGPPFWA